MLRFITYRVLSSIPALFGIVTLVFFIARVLPGDPCRAALGERATEQMCAEYSARVGLDRALPVQFGEYVRQLLRGDFGQSISTRQSVAQLLIDRLPLTIELAIGALFLAILIGVPLGVIAAYRRNSLVDAGTMIVANAGVSVPVFVLAMLAKQLFSVRLRDTPFALPPQGRLPPGTIPRPFYEAWGLPKNVVLDFMSNLEILNGILQWDWALTGLAFKHLILPAAVVSTIPLAIIARMTRSSVLDVLGQDYVRTARAKGLRELVVVRRHALRSALLPVVTVVGLSLGGLLSGAILTESIFGLTGVGTTLTTGITGRDYSAIQGFTLVVGISFVFINLITDIAYTMLDPRVRAQ